MPLFLLAFAAFSCLVNRVAHRADFDRKYPQLAAPAAPIAPKAPRARRDEDCFGAETTCLLEAR